MPAKRIAIVGNQALGLVNFRGALMAELVVRGCEVLAFAPDYTATQRSSLIAAGVRPVDYPLRRSGLNVLRDLGVGWRLSRMFRSLKPDLVLCYTVKPIFLGIPAALFAGVPRRYAMIEGLGRLYAPSTALIDRLVRWTVSGLYRLTLTGATRTLFLNRDDLSEFVEGGIVAAERVENIGAIGVDLDRWAMEAPVLDPVTFVFIGRLLRQKGIVEFLEAARRIKARSGRTRFVVLGGTERGGIGEGELQAAVDDGLVDWRGHVDDVQRYLAAASVFVLPSYYREGVPRSTQEAMAMGRPIITTDTPGCRETVVDGDNGFFVPARDPEALTRAMLEFVDDPSLIESMGRRSRRLAEARFDVREASARTLKALEL